VNTSTRRISVLAVGAALALLLVWYAALFRPASHHLSSARRSYASAQQQVSQLQQQVVSLEALEKQIPADKAHLAQLDAAVPHSPDLKGLLDQLHALATATGVQLTIVSPSQPASTTGSPAAASALGGAQTSQVVLTMTGSYQQIAAFLTGLSRMPRAVVVDTANITAAAGHGLTAELTTQIFYTS
jgi:Tfp pilus assembly protein PilO